MGPDRKSMAGGGVWVLVWGGGQGVGGGGHPPHRLKRRKNVRAGTA